MTTDIDALRASGDIITGRELQERETAVEAVARAIERLRWELAMKQVRGEVIPSKESSVLVARAAIAAMPRNEHSSPEMVKLAAEVLADETDLEALERFNEAGERYGDHGDFGGVRALIRLARAAKRLAGSVLTQAEDKP